MASIAAPRLAPYLACTGGNPTRALRLYEWNIDLSAGVYGILHRFEVILRNAIDARLCIWNATQRDRDTNRSYGSDWLLDPAPLLARLAERAVTEAADRAATAAAGRPNPTVGHADVLAQTSFGTWRFLLPDTDAGRQLLWKAEIAHAFPHLPTGYSGQAVTDEVDRVYQLRNRVAHLEPLLNAGRTQRQIKAAYDVAGWIDPELRTWLTSTQRVATLLKTRSRI